MSLSPLIRLGTSTWTLIFLSVLIVGCTSPTAVYLAEGLGKATQDEVRKELGPPVKELTLNTNETLWLYQVRWYPVKGYVKECSGYKLRFDDQKVLRQWNNVPCSEEL